EDPPGQPERVAALHARRLSPARAGQPGLRACAVEQLLGAGIKDSGPRPAGSVGQGNAPRLPVAVARPGIGLARRVVVRLGLLVTVRRLARPARGPWVLRSRLRRWGGERAAVRPAGRSRPPRRGRGAGSGRTWPARGRSRPPRRGPGSACGRSWPARGRTWPARLGP